MQKFKLAIQSYFANSMVQDIIRHNLLLNILSFNLFQRNTTSHLTCPATQTHAKLTKSKLHINSCQIHLPYIIYLYVILTNQTIPLTSGDPTQCKLLPITIYNPPNTQQLYQELFLCIHRYSSQAIQHQRTFITNE